MEFNPSCNDSQGSGISQTGGGEPIPKVGVPSYYLAKFLPKTALKWKKRDWKACTHPWRYPWIRQCNAWSKDGSMQWRIQDFPEVGALTFRGRQHTILPKFPKKTAWNWKNLDPKGGGMHPLCPLGSTNSQCNAWSWMAQCVWIRWFTL